MVTVDLARNHVVVKDDHAYDAMTVLAQLVADDVPSMGERIAEIMAEAREPAARKGSSP
mgnify:CR=1 FL=1